jgi:hypothetical protein
MKDGAKGLVPLLSAGASVHVVDPRGFPIFLNRGKAQALQFFVLPIGKPAPNFPEVLYALAARR